MPGLDRLIEMLQQAELPVGASEAIDAARLVAALARRTDRAAQERAALKGPLRAVLCKRRGDLATFDTVFDTWAELPAEGAPAGHEASASAHKPGPVAAPPARWRDRLGNWIAAAIIGTLAAVALWNALRPPPAPAPVAQAPTPAAATEAAPEAPAARPAAQPEIGAFGYFPLLRTNVELHPAWLVALALLALAGLAPLAFAAREAPGLTRRSGRPRALLEPWSRAKALAHLVPGLPPATEGMLQRHIRGSAQDVQAYARRPQLDLRRTVAATIEHLGMPTPRLRFARLKPAYLVLAQARRDDDIELLWTERLRGIDARVEIFRFEFNPARPATPLCIEVGGSGRRLRLDQLPNPPPGQRLIIGSRLDLFFDGGGTTLRAFVRAARLGRWRERALFTHEEPQFWNLAQVTALETSAPGDPGLLVFPLDDNALAAWSQWLHRGVLPEITLSEPTNFPPLLAASADEFCDDGLPAGADAGATTVTDEAVANKAARLLAELRVYLGSNGLYWLAACAVPPLLDRRLALLLGEEYFLRTGAPEPRVRHYMALNWSRLVRLPWLREPPRQMPLWLRVALLAQLPRHIQAELRLVVEKAIALRTRRLDDPTLARAAATEPDALPLGFDESHRAPPGPLDAGDERLLFYVGFVQQGLDADQLALRLEGPWRAWLPSLLPRQRWLDRWRAGWARLLHRGGVRGSGPGKAPIVFGAACALGALALGAWLALVAPGSLSEPLRPWVFEEKTRQVATREMDDDFGEPSLSPDGRWIALVGPSWSARSGVSVWQAGGERLTTINGGRETTAVAWSPDGRLLATLDRASESADDRLQTLRLWEVGAWRELRRFPVEPFSSGLTFADDGQVVAILGTANVHRYAVADGAPLPSASLPAELDTTGRPELLPGGRHVLITHRPGRVRLVQVGLDKPWDVDTGGEVEAATFDPGRRRLAVLGTDRQLRVFDRSGRMLAARASPAPPPRDEALDNEYRLHHTPDGRRLVMTSPDGTWLLDADTLEVVGPELAAGRYASFVGFSSDGRLLALRRGGRRVALWSGAAAHAAATLVGPETPAAGAAFAGDGTGWLLTLPAAGERDAEFWQRDSDGLWRPLESLRQLAGGTIAVRNGVVAQASTGAVVHFDPTTRTTTSVDAISGALRAAHTTADGRTVLVAGVDTRAAAGSQGVLGRLSLDPRVAATDPQRSIDTGAYSEASFSDDGALLATWGASAGLRLFASSDGRLLGTLAAPLRVRIVWGRDRVAALAGRAVAVAPFAGAAAPGGAGGGRDADDGERTLRLLDLGTAEALQAAFSPDGRRLAAAGSDGAVRVWDAGRGTLLGVPFVARGPLGRLSWTADGMRLAVAVSEAPAQAQVQAQIRTPATTPAATPPAAASDRRQAIDIDLDAEWPAQRPGVYVVLAPPLETAAPVQTLRWRREHLAGSAVLVAALSFLLVLLPALGWALWRAAGAQRRLWPAAAAIGRPAR